MIYQLIDGLELDIRLDDLAFTVGVHKILVELLLFLEKHPAHDAILGGIGVLMELRVVDSQDDVEASEDMEAVIFNCDNTKQCLDACERVWQKLR